MNTVTISGRIPFDPRTIKGGISFAVDAGQDREKKNWSLNVVAFRATGERARELVSKGAWVTVTGFLTPNTFIKKDGTHVQSVDVFAQAVEPYVKKADRSVAFDERKPASRDDYGKALEITDDDIPF